MDEAIQEKHTWFKAYNALQKAGKIAETKESKTVYMSAKRMAKHAISDWHSFRQRRRNLLPYPQMVMVFSVSPNRWTTQTRTFWMRIVYAMMLVSLRSLVKTRLKHGLSNMLGFSMLSLCGPAMSPLKSILLGVHQDSVLSPLFFILVLEELRLHKTGDQSKLCLPQVWWQGSTHRW